VFLVKAADRVDSSLGDTADVRLKNVGLKKDSSGVIFGLITLQLSLFCNNVLS